MFRKGQKLVCIKRGKWTSHASALSPYGDPSYGEIVTVVGTVEGDLVLEKYSQPFDWEGGLFRYNYSPDQFRPIIGDSCIDELVTKEEVKETSDLTIKVPELV